MQKLREQNLRLSVYDYLYFQQIQGARKAAGMITEKQFVFYVDLNRCSNHENMLKKISNAIYLEDDNNIYNICGSVASVAAVGDYFYLYLPENKDLSEEQFLIITNIFDQINQFNKEQEYVQDRVKVKTFGTTANDKYYEFDTFDMEVVKEFLALQIVNRKIELKPEEIVGVSLEKIKKNKSQSNFSYIFR